jgi:hypothetical protein
MKKEDFPEIMVYGLYDPDTEELRYIGKTCRGWLRIRDHLSPKCAQDNSYKSRWLRTLFSVGKAPVVRVLLECTTDQQALDEEVRLIREARERGDRLTNITDGGEGFKGLTITPETSAKVGASLHTRWVNLSDDARAEELERIHRNLHTPETREKVRKSMIGVKMTLTPKLLASQEARRGKPISEETKAKISKANLGKSRGPIPAEVRARMSAAWTPEKREARSKKYMGRKASAETRAKQSASKKGRVLSPETREKISAAQRGVPRPYAANPSDETRAKLSRASKGRKASQETIEKRRASLRVYLDTHPPRIPTAEENAKRSASLKIAWAKRKADLLSKKASEQPGSVGQADVEVL